MIWLFLLFFTVIGAPVFAIMGGATQLAWLLHPNEAMQQVRYLAPDVLDERFAGSPILVTVPLFTFIGYSLALSGAPMRIVRAAQAVFGWAPGGLAIVCIWASAFFTTFTGGSAITIVAIGALLFPAMLKAGYPEAFSLGVVMTCGSVGSLLPPSLPILVYSLVAGLDFNKGFKCGILPGLLTVILLCCYASYVAIRHKIPRQRFELREAGSALWLIKWELGIPVLILGALATGLAALDEVAAIATLYTLAIQRFAYKELAWRDLPRSIRNSVGLAGAVLLIMSMAMSLTNFVITEQIPDKIYQWVTDFGVKTQWQFLISLNFFLFLEGTILDGFSVILVTVPLLIPFAAAFGLHPFHLQMMFLLNMEIGALSPPLGQNLFVTAFRFNKPMTYLFKICLPFLGIMCIGLVLIMVFEKISTVAIEGDIAAAKARAAQFNEPPREAWLMECVQEDRNDPQPCTPEDKKKWGKKPPEKKGAPGAEPGKEETEDEMLERLLKGEEGGKEEAPVEDELMKELMGEGGSPPAPSGSAVP